MSTERMPRQTAHETPSRQVFVDYWRAGIIILVVLHHVAVVYAGTVPFYYVEPNDALAAGVLTVFLLFNQAWFMGALFLVSGYFTTGSYDRRTPGSFFKHRLLRLGVPLLLFFFMFSPIAVSGMYQMPASLTGITTPLTWQHYPRLLGIGPLWFVEMLLIFDLGYAVWRVATRNRKMEKAAAPGLLSTRMIVIFVLALALAGYLIRMVIPMGKTVMEFPTLSYFPQYLGLFIVGALASRRDWFRTIPDAMGKRGFIAALLATAILFPLALTGRFGLPTAFLGSGHWQSAVYALWDSIMAAGICLTMITLFRRFFDRQSGLGDFLSRHSFAVYVVHIPLVVWLAIALRGLHAENLLKFGLLTIIAVPLSFAAAYVFRKLPGMSRVL
jgi:glucan biosynthesis protein C